LTIGTGAVAVATLGAAASTPSTTRSCAGLNSGSPNARPAAAPCPAAAPIRSVTSLSCRRLGEEPPPDVCHCVCKDLQAFRAIGLHETVCFQRSGLESTNSDEPFLFSITHDRYGSISHPQQNGMLAQPQPMRPSSRAQRKINAPPTFLWRAIFFIFVRGRQRTDDKLERGEEAGVKEHKDMASVPDATPRRRSRSCSRQRTSRLATHVTPCRQRTSNFASNARHASLSMEAVMCRRCRRGHSA
jgi:hypothetical protein